MVEPWNWTGERVAFAIMHLVLVWDWKTKRQGDAPRPRTAAGPRGYRTSPRQYVTNTLKKGCNGGKMQKNPLFFTMWGGMAKATDTPVLVGKPRSPENGRKVKGVAFQGDNGQKR